MNVPHFFNPFAEIRITGDRLPHWEQPGATYLITFRLDDSLPKPLTDAWRSERATWLVDHPEPWSDEIEQEYHALFSKRIDLLLDAGHGSCHLRHPELRRHLAETLEQGNGDRYFLHSWVVMPNHVHVLATFGPDVSLAEEVAGWKSISARRINRHISRSGPLWQKNYFDRLVRDESHFANCVRYIRKNPEKAHLSPGNFEWVEDDLACQITS